MTFDGYCRTIYMSLPRQSAYNFLRSFYFFKLYLLHMAWFCVLMVKSTSEYGTKTTVFPNAVYGHFRFCR